MTDTQEKMAEARHLRRLASNGGMEYEKAKSLAEPLLKEINVAKAKIDKRFGKKHYPFQFTDL